MKRLKAWYKRGPSQDLAEFTNIFGLTIAGGSIVWTKYLHDITSKASLGFLLLWPIMLARFEHKLKKIDEIVEEMMENNA